MDNEKIKSFIEKWFKRDGLIVTTSEIILIIILSLCAIYLIRPRLFKYESKTLITDIQGNQTVDKTTPSSSKNLANNNQNPQPQSQPQSKPTTPGPINKYLDTSLSLGKCQNPLPVVKSTSGQVQWLEPVSLPDAQIFNGDVGAHASYLVGKVLFGKYKGGDLILSTVPHAGMFGYEAYDHSVSFDGKYYFLTKYSEDKLTGDDAITLLPGTSVDNDFDLTDLDTPQVFHTSNPVSDFSQLPDLFGFDQFADQRFCADNKALAFNEPGVGDVYVLNKNERSSGLDSPITPTSFYVKAPDSTQRVYVVQPDFMGQNNDIPFVSWNDTGQNTQKYTYQNMTVCGPLSFTDIADVQSSSLVQTGTTFNGHAVLEYKDPQDPKLKDVYDNIGVYNGAIKPSYESFLSNHPVFFWKGPFGFYIRFINEQYEHSTYCG